MLKNQKITKPETRPEIGSTSYKIVFPQTKYEEDHPGLDFDGPEGGKQARSLKKRVLVKHIFFEKH